jgi:hypothetical protein
LFWALALFYLLPVWSFRYLPTQDGSSHLSNAFIIKDYGKANTSYDSFFELRLEPIPNWTSHLLLTGLMYVVPPLVAEKLLVSLYILGFAGTFRYYLGSFGNRCRPISWLVFLFIYNRCLWMGFYNYGLSVILVWLVWAYCIRRRGAPGVREGVVLMFLFSAAYFTHLLGFALAFAGAVGAALLLKPRSLARLGLVGLAALPAAVWTTAYLDNTRFFNSGAGRLLMTPFMSLLRHGTMEFTLGQALRGFGQDIFEHHAGRSPLPVLVLLLCALIAAFQVVGYLRNEHKEQELIGLCYPLVMALLVLGLYLLAPDCLGVANGVLPNGGFLKARLVLVGPLALLACLREPLQPLARFLVRWGTVTLAGLNLIMVHQAVQAGSQLLDNYTAGIEFVGQGQRIFGFTAGKGDGLVNPLAGAVNYYCLENNNVWIHNYEALTPHFPVKYRQGKVPSNMLDFADIVICWQSLPVLDEQWQEVFARGPLRILRRSVGK